MGTNINFQIGNWVCAHDMMRDNIDIVGFVVDNLSDKYLIIYSPNPKINCIVALPYLRYEFTSLAIESFEEDIHSMIDIALATKDRKWFEELSQRLERIAQQKKVVQEIEATISKNYIVRERRES